MMDVKTKEEFKQFIMRICENTNREYAMARYMLHDWDEMWRMGYRSPSEAFDEALRCE